ncbi:uncharacterized protein BT62DRAFT_932072 [Guyanagaster necrorhizus]|uniref:4a-hydroxytetrahydrobiopterin dehydratase n=1 Tax=Guyanagaster necrorhizus TaxID=856835 RepID=A0A9P8AT55_9AGAR|nr:uncharacterized protein BT62DRAFT_932072 [Guyanagaster necrorhizus MCA 3950]KAG7446631.1 hypothetical protein BT62DRAFT_932072 [Guyanagaster necrorhizus MCA 3950]
MLQVRAPSSRGLVPGFRHYLRTSQGNVDLPPLLATTAPAAWLSEDELRQYIPPLIRVGWCLRWSTKLKSCRLSSEFPVAGYKTAMRFMNDVSEIADEENHHPEQISFANKRLSISVQTHSALSPPISPLGQDAGEPVLYKYPGVTLRDVRFAMLVQRQYMENYQPEPRKPRDAPEPPEVLTDGSLLRGILECAGIPYAAD